ncbi:MAG: mechanosensitive ion channel family protein [Planctomycetota bacterium]|jgi:MscS family membrane protein
MPNRQVIKVVVLCVLIVVLAGGVLSAGEPAPAPQSAGPEHSWLGRLVPESLHRVPILLQWWQWIALLVLVALAVSADWIVAAVLRRLIARVLETEKFKGLQGKIEIPEKLWKKAERPFGLVAAGLLVILLLPIVALDGHVNDIFRLAAVFVVAAASVWASYRLMDLISVYLLHLTSKTETKLDDMLIPLVRKISKVFVLAAGVVFVADNLGVQVGSLLAGLGIGGLAFALAAKDTVANIFGSITVLFDQPFQVGDWVVVGKTEGTVERVGFRSTRIRTFYNSLITLPNSQLISTVVDNFGSRAYRRYKSRFGLSYDATPEQVEAFCEGLRELVRIHPYTRKDYFHVYLNELGESALEVLVYIFHETPDWSTELRERHRFLLDALRLGARIGVDFAFPTRTVILESPAEGKRAPKPVKKAAKPAKKGAKKKAAKAPPAEDALELGRRAALDVVRETLAEGEIPPPVTFN